MSKKIFPSSGNGKGAESSVVTVDENNGNVSVTTVTASYITVDGLNGLAKISSGQINSLDITTAQSGNILQSQGGQFIPKAASLQSLGGDLDGLVSNATVISIANVTSGTLAVNVGGTAKNSLTSGSILTLNQSNVDATSGSLLTVNSAGNVWQATGSALLEVVPLAEPIIYLYTGSAQTISTFNWIKPVGAKFIRVICQGSGGGGGRGQTADGGYAPAGGGGGGGGYSDVIFNSNFLPEQVTVTLGIPGRGGAYSGGNNGGNGGGSQFGSYLSANGGTGGTFAGVGGAGGTGYTTNGGNGGNQGVAGGSLTTSYGAPGGGGGGRPAAGVGGSTSIAAGGAVGTAGTSYHGQPGSTNSYFKFKQYYINNVLTNQMQNLTSGGGGGGTGTGASVAGGFGGTASWGAGGGGGGAKNTNLNGGGAGGRGGLGYVLIICY